MPEELVFNIMWYIEHNYKLSSKDIKGFLEHYPNYYVKNVKCYRIIGANECDVVPEITIDRDKSWTTKKKYIFQQYLEAFDYYFKFESIVDGIDFKNFLSDCKYHNNPKISKLNRFVKEKEVYAMKIESIKYIGIVKDELLHNIINPQFKVSELLEIDGIAL